MHTALDGGIYAVQNRCHHKTFLFYGSVTGTVLPSRALIMKHTHKIPVIDWFICDSNTPFILQSYYLVQTRQRISIHRLRTPMAMNIESALSILLATRRPRAPASRHINHAVNCTMPQLTINQDQPTIAPCSQSDTRTDTMDTRAFLCTPSAIRARRAHALPKEQSVPAYFYFHQRSLDPRGRPQPLA